MNASVLAAYYARVQVGLAFTLEANAVSRLWPLNAILLAVLLVSAPASWPWLLLAVLPAHLLAQLSASLSAVLMLVAFTMFHLPHSGAEAVVYAYAPLPVLIWAAVRFGVGASPSRSPRSHCCE